MKQVLYVLLSHFAEHEMPYLTQPLRSDAMSMKEHPKFENRIVAESMEPVAPKCTRAASWENWQPMPLMCMII